MENSVYRKIFTWLFIGLLLTFGCGYFLSLNENLAMKLIALGALPILIIELVIAFLMGLRIKKMKPLTAKLFYLIFCITTGITFSTIFMIYEMKSLLSIFLISALIFGVLALYGYKTKRNLSKFGFIITITLLVLIISSLLNIFLFKSPMADVVISGLCILIFCGYIAYDMNRVKTLLPILEEEKTAVYGAFQLYLDFINLFIRLLEIFGNRKD